MMNGTSAPSRGSMMNCEISNLSAAGDERLKVVFDSLDIDHAKV